MDSSENERLTGDECQGWLKKEDKKKNASFDFNRRISSDLTK